MATTGTSFTGMALSTTSIGSHGGLIAAIPNATITVYQYKTTTPATLYTDITCVTPLGTNAVVADSNGNFEFFAPVGSYTYSVSGDGVDPRSFDISDVSSSGLEIGGANTQVQFNDAGVLNGDMSLTWDNTNKVLTVGDGTAEANDRGLLVVVDTTDDTTNGTFNCFEADLNLAPASAASSNNWTGIASHINTSGDQDFTEPVAGVTAIVFSSAVGTTTSLQGVSVLVEHAEATGIVQSLIGVDSVASCLGTSTTLQAAGRFQTGAGADSSIANSAAIQVSSPSFVGGSIAHQYGIYVDDQQTPAVEGNTDPWSIYVVAGVSRVSGLATALVAKSATYEATPDDHTINGTGSWTLTIPATGVKLGHEYRIKNVGSGTITVSCAVNIDGSTSLTLDAGDAATIQWDGAQWWTY